MRPIPYNEVEFKGMGILDAWDKYLDVLSWGKGQTIAILDDGFDLNDPQWKVTMPWGPKVVATYNAIEDNNDVTVIPPAYHGTSLGYPSSMNLDGNLGVAFNDQVALIKCVPGGACKWEDAPAIARALNWVINNRERYNITSVNIGTLDAKSHRQPVPTVIDDPLRTLRELGIWVSAPTGNSGHIDGISWPACANDCFGVGAVHHLTGVPHLNRYSNIAIVAHADATSGSNAYLAGAAMLVREAIEKTGYDWTSDGPNLADATLAILKKTGIEVKDPVTGFHFAQLNLLKTLDYFFEKEKSE